MSQLLNDLDSIFSWTEINNLAMNAKKLELLRYSPNVQLTTGTSYVSNNGSIITEKANLRDLGVTMCNSANFKTHINQMIKKAKQETGRILRSFENRSKDAMLTLWKSRVIPILEYCSILWNPGKASDIQSIELL